MTSHTHRISLALVAAGLLAACTPHPQPRQVGEAPSRPTAPTVTPATPPLAPGEPELAASQRREQAAKRPAPVARLLSQEAGMAASDLAAPAPGPSLRRPSEPPDRERYAHIDGNPVHRVAETPVSTFSIDVDTGAYSNVRRFLQGGRLPARDAVRVEELINYFAYDYPTPADPSTPFKVTVEAGPTPWNPHTRLLHIGIKGYAPPRDQLPAANLVFLVDVSGSMQAANKLGLLKSALGLLARQLRARDRIAIAVYAGASGVVLESVPGTQQAKILRALEGLSAGGSTNGGAGIRLAYRLAREGYIEGGINRVLLATDGDFNVGTVGFQALRDLVAERRRGGIALTTLGFGTGNYNDHLMEQLADAGNGNYAYIDTLSEAQKVLVDELGATLNTIAKDVKIQVEFNPSVVAEYRLIGYENRALRREDFNNDRVDAGEIGAGHTVTALYEIALAGGAGSRIDPLRYAMAVPAKHDHAGEVAWLRLRYKDPKGGPSRLIERVIERSEIRAALADTSDTYRFAAAVAGFGQLLRGGTYLEQFDYPDLLALARDARGHDPFGYRGEFLGLVNLARSLGTSKTDARE